MPASLYQELVDPTGSIKQMIVLKKDKTHQSSDQFVMPLLCQACEIRFQKGGEDWVLGNRYRSDGTFPMRDMLLRAAPVETKPDGSNVFAAKLVGGLEVEQLIYFAASLFWRAAITDWKVRFADAPKIDLDASLMAELRSYLLGSASFPARASIFIAVDVVTAPWRAMWSPMKQNDKPTLRYSLYIPGMIMELGVDLAAELRVPSISDATELVVLSDVVHKYVAMIGSQLAEQSELSKSLARHFPAGRP